MERIGAAMPASLSLESKMLGAPFAPSTAGQIARLPRKWRLPRARGADPSHLHVEGLDGRTRVTAGCHRLIRDLGFGPSAAGEVAGRYDAAVKATATRAFSRASLTA